MNVRPRPLAVVVLALGCGFGIAHAQQPDGEPLFGGTEPLLLTLRSDFDALEGDRGEERPERPGELLLTDEAGAPRALPVLLRTRGNFRRSRTNCFMPPLRVEFDDRGSAGTVFEGQDRLKIVGNCRPGRGTWEALVLREYLAYRILGAVTDAAFRVRLARITYEDTSGERGSWTEWAFFIEDEERLAARLGGSVFELDEGRNLPAEAFDAPSAVRLAVFQYLIGNTDWSEVAGHNVTLLERAGRAFAVPYDFDFSGLVEAPYATPGPETGLGSVRERRYQGWCRPPGVAEAVAAEFRGARTSIETEIADFGFLDEDARRDLLDYLRPVLVDLEDPVRADRAFLGRCRSLPGGRP